MTSFIFVRHGQSQANADGIIANAYSPLTEGGIEQARKTAKEVKALGVTMIACSPYLRAQQSAEIIAGELGIDLAHIKIIDELRERGLGVLENKPKGHDGAWYFLDEESEGIESREGLFGRMTQALHIIRELSKTNTVLVVGHSVAGFYLLQAAAMKASLEAFDPPSQMNNADYVKVNLED
ncbi:MAG: histidine phosphatase family protein [Patescibacteria group bacterium]